MATFRDREPPRQPADPPQDAVRIMNERREMLDRFEVALDLADEVSFPCALRVNRRDRCRQPSSSTQGQTLTPDAPEAVLALTDL